MAGRKHTAEQIIAMLRQIEVAFGNGNSTPQACREAGITEQTYYRWRKEYGGATQHCELGTPRILGTYGSPHRKYKHPHRLRDNFPPDPTYLRNAAQR